jgi:hypothetical protein
MEKEMGASLSARAWPTSRWGIESGAARVTALATPSAVESASLCNANVSC